VPLHFSYDQPYPAGYDAPKAFGYEAYPSSQGSSASASSLDSLLVHPSDTVEPCATYLSYPDPEPAIHAPVPQPSHTPILYWTGADVEASLAAYQPPPVEEVVAPQAAPPLPAAQPVSLPGYWQFVPQVSNSTSTSSSEQQPPPTAHASYSWPAQHAAPPSLPPLVVNPAPVTRMHQPSARHVPTSPSIRLPALWPKVPSVAPRQSPDQHTAPPAALQQPWVPPTPVASTPSRLPQTQPKRKRKRDDDEDSSDDGFSLAVHLWPSEKRARYFAASETRRRALAERVGFLPTDPCVLLSPVRRWRRWLTSHRETLSSHDKKRAYVECMEQYIEFLHQQLRLVGHEPVAMEKVESYSGLNTRSIRVSSSLAEGELGC
jgi:hypothetical protein